MFELANKPIFKLDLPEPIPLQDMLDMNVKVTEDLTKFFDARITTAEAAAIELVNRFVDEFDLRAVNDVKYNWMKVEYLRHGESIDYGPVSETDGMHSFFKTIFQ